MTTPPRAGRKEWIGLAVLTLPCLLYAMDLTVLHLAVPRLSAELRPSSAELLWIIDIYGFLVAGSLITMGTLGDRIGRRRLLLIGAAAFGAASVVAAFSTTAELLIVARALLGVAGATVAPSTMSLIRNMFHDPRQFATAIAVWISSYTAGGAIGPVLGGVVLEHFWWGAIFLMSVPVMLLVLLLGPLLLPEYRDPAAGRPDVLSAALSLVAMLGVVFGLKQIAQDGIGWQAALMILGGLGAGLAFVRRQLQLADPLVDLRLFRVTAFSASLTLYGLGIFIMFGGMFFGPQFLQLVLELSPLQAALCSLPAAVASILGAMVTPRLVGRLRPSHLMAGGLVLASIGFAALTRLDATTGVTLFVLANVAFALGITPLITLTNELIIGSAPPERAGAASGISETCAELGGSLGIAVFGSIGVAVYRATLADAIPAAPVEAIAVARDTLGAALAIADQLPDPLGAPLAETARQAFMRGFQVSATLSALGSLGLAAYTLRVLRHARTGSSVGHSTDVLASAVDNARPRDRVGQSTES